METLINLIGSFCSDVFGLFLDIMSMPVFAILTCAFVVGVIFLLIRKEF